jgi:hypothetical protein
MTKPTNNALIPMIVGGGDHEFGLNPFSKIEFDKDMKF